MTRIPVSALALGLAGLLPFLWGAAGILAPGLTAWALGYLPGRFHGAAVMQIYGLVILSCMPGAIWSFATRATGRLATYFYALSVLPPSWAFLTSTGASGLALMALLLGSVALLPLGWPAARGGLAPSWCVSL